MRRCMAHPKSAGFQPWYEGEGPAEPLDRQTPGWPGCRLNPRQRLPLRRGPVSLRMRPISSL